MERKGGFTQEASNLGKQPKDVQRSPLKFWVKEQGFKKGNSGQEITYMLMKRAGKIRTHNEGR